jgi:di/tricarboxylate transporter
VILSTIAEWSSLCALTILVFKHGERRKMGKNILLLILVTPLHLAYAAVIVLSVLSGLVTSAECSGNDAIPVIMYVPNALYVLTWLVGFVFYCSKFCIRWSDKKREEVPVSELIEFE